MKSKTYENYSCLIIFITNFVSISIYLIGILIISQISLIFGGIYLLYIIFLEIKLLKQGCTNCYYYGKHCAFGKGKTSSWFFKRGNTNEFANKKITWKNILPYLLVSVIPLIIGIILSILHFDWILLVLIILLLILSSVGNGFVRSSLACKFCKQREIGCPAEQLFKKSHK